MEVPSRFGETSERVRRSFRVPFSASILSIIILSQNIIATTMSSEKVISIFVVAKKIKMNCIVEIHLFNGIDHTNNVQPWDFFLIPFFQRIF